MFSGVRAAADGKQAARRKCAVRLHTRRGGLESSGYLLRNRPCDCWRKSSVHSSADYRGHNVSHSARHQALNGLERTNHLDQQRAHHMVLPNPAPHCRRSALAANELIDDVNKVDVKEALEAARRT